MTAQSDLDGVRHAVHDLRHAVRTLRASWGDTLGMRRLESDVERLAADLDELGPPARGLAAPRTETEPLEVIPDKDYGREFWLDAEDEGLGGLGHRPAR